MFVPAASMWTPFCKVSPMYRNPTAIADSSEGFASVFFSFSVFSIFPFFIFPCFCRYFSFFVFSCFSIFSLKKKMMTLAIDESFFCFGCDLTHVAVSATLPVLDCLVDVRRVI